MVSRAMKKQCFTRLFFYELRGAQLFARVAPLFMCVSVEAGDMTPPHTEQASQKTKSGFLVNNTSLSFCGTIYAENTEKEKRDAFFSTLLHFEKEEEAPSLRRQQGGERNAQKG